MSVQPYPQNGQGQPGQPETPPLPPTIRTAILMGGQLWNVDENVDVVVTRITTFLLGTEQALELKADRRPIYFARKLVELWATAWAVNQNLVTVPDPHTARMFNEGR